jgi:hypothetical protein
MWGDKATDCASCGHEEGKHARSCPTLQTNAVYFKRGKFRQVPYRDGYTAWNWTTNKWDYLNAPLTSAL